MLVWTGIIRLSIAVATIVKNYLLHAGLDIQKLLQNCTIDDKLKQQYFSEFYNVHFMPTIIIDSVMAYSYVLRDLTGFLYFQDMKGCKY